MQRAFETTNLSRVASAIPVLFFSRGPQLRVGVVLFFPHCVFDLVEFVLSGPL
jgi:hypothetical protein